ncbi:MAG: hypothetical protein EBW47_00475 [Betaproteobacteria bacterium]|nr:hypothetical protein [Betaproteobacteria bacterium]
MNALVLRQMTKRSGWVCSRQLHKDSNENTQKSCAVFVQLLSEFKSFFVFFCLEKSLYFNHLREFA